MRRAAFALMLAIATPALAADPTDFAAPGVPPLRDRAAAQDRLLKARLDQVIPRLSIFAQACSG